VHQESVGRPWFKSDLGRPSAQPLRLCGR